MAEIINDKQVFSLFEVSRSVQKTLQARYQSSFWVKAEMNKLNHYSHSGHCYPELVEKKDGKIIAQTKSTLWRRDYVRINEVFQKTLNEPLKEGIKILFLAKISFDALYGFTLQILDIDVNFTLGDLEREKKETIRLLQEEKIFDNNKNLSFPFLPQRIAVISVESSKGYADFLKIIDNNPWQYKFFHHLFPSLLQGDKAADNMVRQLRQIKKVKEHFDVVVIVRGGGGDIGLSCYNNLALSKEIATFPLPILTGIGHATNQTVAEMVAFYNAITPTKLAEFLIQKFHNRSVPIKDAIIRIHQATNKILNEHKIRLNSEIKLFESNTRNILRINHQRIKYESDTLIRETTSRFVNTNQPLNALATDIQRMSFSRISQSNSIISEFQRRLQLQSKQLFSFKLQNLNHLAQTVSILDPSNVLKRGFSITRFNGKALKEVSEVSEGSTVETVLYKGSFESVITKHN